MYLDHSIAVSHGRRSQRESAALSTNLCNDVLVRDQCRFPAAQLAYDIRYQDGPLIVFATGQRSHATA